MSKSLEIDTKKSADIFLRLGLNKRPFEGVPAGINTKIEEGEDITDVFAEYVFHPRLGEDLIPPNVVSAKPEDILSQNLPVIKPLTYLWIIDDNGLHIILEQTKNPKARRGVVCHTNITGGAPARQGGELWFGTDGRVYINNKSGRYGGVHIPESQKQAVRDYFESFGYEVEKAPDFFFKPTA